MITIKRDLHTRIEPRYYDLLLKYGNGCLCDGIVRVLWIAETKQYNTKKELKRIAEAILIDDFITSF